MKQYRGTKDVEKAYLAIRNTKRSSWLQDTFNDIDSDDDRVCAIETSIRYHLTNSREDGLVA